MRLRTTVCLALVLLVCMGCVGCAAKNPTSGTSTPVSVQVANLNKALADTLVTSNKTIMQLRDAGKIPQGEVAVIQNYMLKAKDCGKATNAVLSGSDDWPAQRNKIIQVWSRAGLNVATASLSPEAGLALQAIITLVNQILQVVGGPSL